MSFFYKDNKNILSLQFMKTILFRTIFLFQKMELEMLENLETELDVVLVETTRPVFLIVLQNWMN